MSCNGLCSHLYKCNCSDSDLLCKHIHKMHSFKNRKENFKDNIFDYTTENECLDFETQPKGIENFNTNSVENKIESCKDLASELFFLLENPKVQSLMLKNIHTTLNSLVSSCKGIIESDSNKQILTLANSYVPPNQKLILQPRYFKSKKRKIVELNDTKSSSFINRDVDEPPCKQQKPNFLKSEYAYISNSSFTCPLTKFKKFSEPIITVGNYNINFTTL